MTKSEFIQRAAIAIIGNSDFTHSGTQPDEMVEQAKDLAETVEGYGFNFDDEADEPMESLKTLVGHIGDHLDNINLALTDGEHSIQNRLGEIATDHSQNNQFFQKDKWPLLYLQVYPLALLQANITLSRFHQYSDEVLGFEFYIFEQYHPTEAREGFYLQPSKKLRLKDSAW